MPYSSYMAVFLPSPTMHAIFPTHAFCVTFNSFLSSLHAVYTPHAISTWHGVAVGRQDGLSLHPSFPKHTFCDFPYSFLSPCIPSSTLLLCLTSIFTFLSLLPACTPPHSFLPFPYLLYLAPGVTARCSFLVCAFRFCAFLVRGDTFFSPACRLLCANFAQYPHLSSSTISMPLLLPSPSPSLLLSTMCEQHLHKR